MTGHIVGFRKPVPEIVYDVLENDRALFGRIWFPNWPNHQWVDDNRYILAGWCIR